MKITIKNLKHFPTMSEETDCFECTVYVDGTKAFTARNRGNGGCNSYDPFMEGGKGNFVLLHDAEKWAADQPRIPFPEEWGGGDYQPDLDHFINELVADELMRRDRQKAARKGLAFFHPDTPETIEWYPWPRKLDKAQQQHWRTHMLRPGAKIFEAHPNVCWLGADGRVMETTA